MKRVLVLGLLALSACKMGTVNLALTVYPDGSGEAQYYGFIPTDYRNGDKANPDGIIANVDELQAFDVSLKIIGGKFKSIEKVKIGEIEFAFKKTDTGSVIRMTIPTTAEAKWYKSLGMTKEAVEKLKKISEMDAAKKSGGSANEDPPAVVIAIQMPGIIEKQQLLEADPKPDWKMDTEDRGGGGFGGNEQKNTAWLMIPIEDIFAGKTKSVVWEITAGPTIDRVKEAWEKAKKEKDK